MGLTLYINPMVVIDAHQRIARDTLNESRRGVSVNRRGVPTPIGEPSY